MNHLSNSLGLTQTQKLQTWSPDSYYAKFDTDFLFRNVPVNNFSVMSGQSPRFLDITSTFRGVNVSCSRTQHGDPSEDRTPRLPLTPTAITTAALAALTTHSTYYRESHWKSLFAYAKTKSQISFAVTAKLISAFVFATRIVQSLYFLNLKFQASRHLLWLYSPVYVRPGRKPRRQVFS